MDDTTKGLIIPIGPYGEKTFKRGVLVAYHGTSPADAVIRLGSRSYYSHVGVSLGTPDNRLICATYPDGVTANYNALQGGIECEARMLPLPAREVVLLRMLKLIGTPYDLTGWLSAALHKWTPMQWIGNGGAPHTFHCSELIAYCWPEAGWPMKPRQCSPQDVWNRVNS